MLETHMTNSSLRDMAEGKIFFAFSKETFVHQNKVSIDLEKYCVKVVSRFEDGTIEYEIKRKIKDKEMLF